MTGILTDFTPKPLPDRSDKNAAIIDLNFSLLSQVVRSIRSNSARTSSIAPLNLPGGFGGFANPSANSGLVAINGIANTAMRSDSAPAINVAISPTWSGTHTFSLAPVFSSVTASQFLLVNGSKALTSVGSTGSGNVVLATSPTLGGSVSFTGNIGMGSGGPAANNVILIQGSVSGLSGTDQVGVNSQPTMTSASTSSITGVYSLLTTASGSFTVATGYGIRVQNPTIGSGSAITTVYGLKIEDQTHGGTNYAIRTGLGLIQFGDVIAFGGAPVSNIALRIVPSLPGTPDGYGAFVNPSFQTSTTGTARGLYVAIDTAASFTMTSGIGIQIGAPGRGASATIQTVYGLKIEDQTQGNPNNYAIKTGRGVIEFGDIVRIGSVTGNDDVFCINPASVPNTSTVFAGIRLQTQSNSAHTSEVSGAIININGNTNTSVTNVYGLQVIPAASSGTGVFTNNHGIRVFDVSSGTNKYAIRTGLGQVSFGDDTTVTKNIAGFLVSRIYNSNNTASSVGLLELTAGGTSSAYAGVLFDVFGSANSFTIAMVPSTGTLGCQTGPNGIAWYAYQGTTSGYANLSLCGFCSDFHGADSIVFVHDAVNLPSANPSSGGYLYSQAGALKWRGSSGTITTIAPA